MAVKEVRKLAAIMFTDIEGYSAMTQKNEKAALQAVSIHRKHLEQFTAQFNGQVIQFYGDGSLSTYESALDAVHCAIAMQLAYRSDHPIPVRIGVHVGDIVFRDDTVFGDGVNIASRIQASGTSGSVLISDRVKAELANHPEIKTKSIGYRKLKNITNNVEIFAVTNEGLVIPSGKPKTQILKSKLRYSPIVLLALMVWLVFQGPIKKYFSGPTFTEESISVPLFENNTGETDLDHVAQMASHWITKELSVTSNAHVISYETGSEAIQLAGVSIKSGPGQSKYKSLTGAVNFVEGSYMRTGKDSLMMGAFIKNLSTGRVLISLNDVFCDSDNPLDCVKAMSDQIKGYWASRGDNVLTPPTYEAYKAYLAARKAWRTQDKAYVLEQLNKSIRLDPTFMDPYFLMLDYFYNENLPQAAWDTLQVLNKRFTELDERQQNMMMYHTADVKGHNQEAVSFFMKEYALDSKDLFTNNSGMVIALMYEHNPRKALQFFNAIPFDSLTVEGCRYCGERVELAMWAALDVDSMSLADFLVPKINNNLSKRQSYGMLIMYEVWKKDTAAINQLLLKAKAHPQLDRDWEYLVYLTGRLFLLRGDSVLASSYAKKSIEVHRETGGRMLGRSYYLDHQYEKAKTIYLDAQRKKPKDTMIVAELGMIYARLGNKEEATKVIARLETLRTDYEYGATEYYQGRIYALLGDLDKATNSMATAIEKGKKYELWVTFHQDPDLAPLNAFPAYQNLMNSFK